MPRNEDALSLQSVLCSHDRLREHLSVVADVCVHIVDQEWLREVVLVIGERHRLEAQCHSGSRLNITELIQTCGRVRVSVEKLSGSCLILWEVRVRSALIPLLVVIDNVVGCWGEELVELVVREDGVKNVDLVNCWLSALISDSSKQGQSSNEEVELPDQSLGGHAPAECRIAQQSSSPPVIGSVESACNLVQIISSPHSPLPVVVLEDVVAVVELLWVTLCLLRLETMSTSDIRLVVEVVAVKSLGWLKSLVVPAWVSSLSSTGFAWSFVVVIMALSSEAPNRTSNNTSLNKQLFLQHILHHI